MARTNEFQARLPEAEPCLGMDAGAMAQHETVQGVSTEKKARVAYVTSPRELEGEGVGYDPGITPTLGFLLDSIRRGAPGLGNMEIAAVFVDDDGTEGRERVPGSGSGTVPSETFAYLRQECEQNGMVFHVEPSASWRRIPRRDAEAKHAAKMEYERRMLSFMRENRIDVIFSDSYVVLFNSLMLDAKNGFPGLIINVHPGIATEVPGVFPNMDALARAKHFTEDPIERETLIGEIAAGATTVAIRRNGYDGSIARILAKQGVALRQDGEYNYVPVAESRIGYSFTGATLHEVDEFIDHGPAIKLCRETPIMENDSIHQVRTRNYVAKNRTAASGLSEFLSREGTWQLINENRIRNASFAGGLMESRALVRAVQNNRNAKSEMASAMPMRKGLIG